MWSAHEYLSALLPRGGLPLAVVVALLALMPGKPAQALEMRMLDVQGLRVLLLHDEPPSQEFPRGRGFRDGDAQRFAQWLQRGPLPHEVWLHSRGGLVREGLAIGRSIRRAGLPTRIRSEHKCASICTDAFLGGVVRRVDQAGQLGIHMGTMARNEKLIESVLQNIGSCMKDRTCDLFGSFQTFVMDVEQGAAKQAAQWGAYVLEMGGSPRIVELATKTEASSMNYLTRRQMVDLNYINVED